MLFTDPDFLLRFLPLLLALFFLGVAVIPDRWKARGGRFTVANTVLLAGSGWFLAQGTEEFFLRWLAAAMMFTYVLGWGIVWSRVRARSSEQRHLVPAALLTLAVTGNVVLWVVFKYALPQPPIADATMFAVPQLLVPLGLTYVVCHAVSYVTDVARGQGPVQRNPVKACLYLCFFPLLCAGPIVRYSQVAAQLTDRRVTLAGFAYGVRRWVVGVVKVWFLARTLAGPADAAFAMSATQLGVEQAWLGVVCFGFQIYFDLSGYADMAIGFGHIFGFRLPENFRVPYAADSVTDFWRCWNVTLLDWCREYLGWSLERAQILLFLGVGLWHGPGWHVLLWGALHGVVVALEQAGLRSRLMVLPVALRRIYVWLVVLCLWVPFRAVSLPDAALMFQAMLGFGPVTDASTLVVGYPHWIALAVAGLTVMPAWSGLSRWLVTVDALTTSIVILVSTSAVFVWRQCVALVRLLTWWRR